MNNERFTFLKGVRAMALTLFALCAMGVGQANASCVCSAESTVVISKNDDGVCVKALTPADLAVNDCADAATIEAVLVEASEHWRGGTDVSLDPAASILVTVPGRYRYTIKDADGNTLCWNHFVAEDKSGPVCANGEGMEDDGCYFEDDGDCEASKFGYDNDDQLHLKSFAVSCTSDEDPKDQFAVLETNDFMDCTGVEEVYFKDYRYTVGDDTRGCTLEPNEFTGEDLTAMSDLTGLSEEDLLEFMPTLTNVPDGWEICEINFRLWFAKDWAGNTSPIDKNCSQAYAVLRPSKELIEFDWTVTEECDGEDIATRLGDATGSPYFMDLGEEFCGTGDYYQIKPDDHSCKYAATYHEDGPIYTCDDSYDSCADNKTTGKIVRHWTLIDWCASDEDIAMGMNKITGTQIITIEDKTPPTFSLEVSTWPGISLGCEIDLRVDASAMDACSTADYEFFVQVTTGGHSNGSFERYGPFSTSPVRIPNVPLDASVVAYGTAWDCCGNVSEEAREEDGPFDDTTPPQCNADDDLVIALIKADYHGDDGVNVHAIGARVTADAVDEGSRDNCSPVTTLIRMVPEGKQFNNNPHDDDTELYDGWAAYQDYIYTSGDGFDDKCERVEWVDLLAFVDENGNGELDEGEQYSICATQITLFDASKPEISFEECASYKCTDHDVPAFGGPQGVWNPTGDACTDIVYGDPVYTPYHCAIQVACGDTKVASKIGYGIWAIGDWTRTIKVTKWVGHSLFEKEFTQTIYEEVVEDSQFTLPEDVKVNCGEATVPTPTVVNGGCSEWFVSEPEISEFTNGGADGECGVYIYEYEFINKCRLASYEDDYGTIDRNGPNQQMGRNGDPGKATSRSLAIMKMDGITTTVPEMNANLKDGYFRYIQYVVIVDDVDPTATITGVQGCEVSDECEAGTAKFTVTPGDECTSGSITDWYVNVEGNQEGWTRDGDMFSAIGLAKGTYTLHVRVDDECGNFKWFSESVTVTWDDCKKPTVIASSGFTTLMPENCEVEVWVSDLVESVDDNCSGADFLNANLSIELLTDRNGDGSINNNDASDVMPTATGVTIDFAGTSLVAVWIVDEEGNTQFTVVPVGIVDNGNCSHGGGGAAAAVAGKITNEADEMVDGVTVDANGTGFDPFFGLYDGTFNLSIPMNADVTVTPTKDDNHLNGVSGRDILLIQRHIIGLQPITSAFKLIAADVTLDQNINGSDMLAIRKLVLGIDNEFQKVTSWRFVDKNHVFVNPTSPWDFPEAINYASLDADAQADFIGIKMGDVSGNAKASTNLLGSETKSGAMTIAIDDVTIAAGSTREIAFTAKDFKDFAGYQFTIKLADGVAFNKVALGDLPNLSEGNFGLNRLDAGVVTTNWTNVDALDLEDGTVLFTLTVSSTRDVNVSEAITINSDVTAAEAYNGDLDVLGVNAQFNKVAADFALFQNTPNPFSNETTIGFELPTAGDATLRVMDVAGRVLKQVNGTYTAGFHQITLNKSELGATGVLYYQLATDAHRATKKMVILE